VTIGLIVLCFLVQAYASFGAPSEEELFKRAMVIAQDYPGETTLEQDAELARRIEALAQEIPKVKWGYRTGTGPSLNLVTSTFVHDGWLHLIGNMLFLWLAGSALEDRYGRIRFALFYVLGGAGATYAFQIAAKTDGILLVGASGAISACMGAFLIHFHKATIRFWYLLMYRTGTFTLPAWFALPLWLAEQFLWASFDGGTGKSTGVAYAAHIGGFVFGFIVGFIMSKAFPGDAADDDVEYDNPEPPAPGGRREDAALEERMTKLTEAINKRDMGAVRTGSSRVILDLARVNDDVRIVELYQLMASKLTKVPLTVQAFAAAAEAADHRTNTKAYRAIAEAMIADHPMGIGTPKVMWRYAQLLGDAGELEQEKETLISLAKRFPKDEFGQKAARRLDG